MASHPNSLANLRPAWTKKDHPDGNRAPRMPPVTAALRKLFALADESGITNAEKFAQLALQRAQEPGKTGHAWAKLILERVDGPVRREIELSLGLPDLMRGAHDRWLKKKGEPPKADPPEPARD